jgi:hypothetical protein
MFKFELSVETRAWMGLQARRAAGCGLRDARRMVLETGTRKTEKDYKNGGLPGSTHRASNLKL